MRGLTHANSLKFSRTPSWWLHMDRALDRLQTATLQHLAGPIAL